MFWVGILGWKNNGFHVLKTWFTNEKLFVAVESSSARSFTSLARNRMTSFHSTTSKELSVLSRILGFSLPFQNIGVWWWTRVVRFSILIMVVVSRLHSAYLSATTMMIVIILFHATNSILALAIVATSRVCLLAFCFLENYCSQKWRILTESQIHCLSAVFFILMTSNAWVDNCEHEIQPKIQKRIRLDARILFIVNKHRAEQNMHLKL